MEESDIYIESDKDGGTTEKINDAGGDLKALKVEQDENRKVAEDEKWTTEKIKDKGRVVTVEAVVKVEGHGEIDQDEDRKFDEDEKRTTEKIKDAT